jgi:hypothetical protein
MRLPKHPDDDQIDDIAEFIKENQISHRLKAELVSRSAAIKLFRNLLSPSLFVEDQSFLIQVDPIAVESIWVCHQSMFNSWCDVSTLFRFLIGNSQMFATVNISRRRCYAVDQTVRPALRSMRKS